MVGNPPASAGDMGLIPGAATREATAMRSQLSSERRQAEA